MSVLKNLRALSEMQFYKTAITIRKELTIWLLKDFGTRRNAKSVNQVIKDITPEEQAQIDAIFARYGRTSRRTYQSEYPDWFVEFERKIISENLAEMVTNITQANSIFPYFAFEWDLRRKYQDMAICNCYKLYHWKVIKCYEATLKGIPAPYNVEELLVERQQIRDRINEIEALLA